MKVKIAGTDDDTLYLKLTEDSFGVTLIATDSRGNRRTSPNLLRIDSSGRCLLFSNINKGLGLDTDDAGYLIPHRE